MCGLAGWYFPDFPASARREVLLKHLARKNQSRGADSFGLAFAEKGAVKAHKATMSASKWLDKHKDEIAKMARSPIVLIHTRMPSRGEVSLENTHPFNIGPWWVAHNGTFGNSSELMNKSLYIAKGETDSEEMACHFVGASFSREAINEARGNFAVTAVRIDGTELVIVVDSIQSFHIAHLGDGIVWASEEKVLGSSLQAANIKADIQKVEDIILTIRLVDGKPVAGGGKLKLEAPPAATRQLELQSKGSGFVNYAGNIMTREDYEEFIGSEGMLG